MSMITGDTGPETYDDSFEAAPNLYDVATDSVSAQFEQIKELLRTSGEFFIEFFLGDELAFPVPMIHKEIWSLLTDMTKKRVLLAIPRDHAKTTLAKLAVVWYFLFTNHRFCVYLSNTNTIAKNACKDIMEFLKSPNFESVFGKIRILKESETDSLWMFEINVGGKTKRCILRAVGAGQQMRGINIDNQRPDIAVVDDVEDNENTESETLQKKLDRWMFGPFLKALARNRKILWLGNMLSKTSLLARLSQQETWNPVVFGCLVTNPETGSLVPLWPDRWPIQDLIEDFNEYRDLGLLETWMCEMMNMPGHGKNGFTADSVYWQPMPTSDEVHAAFLVLDPAFGEEQVNDDSSITVHVIREDGLPIVAEEITGKMTEAEIFENMVMLGQKWNSWVWGIESIAAQKLLISLFSLLLAQRQMHGVVQMLPLMSGRGDPKLQRIISFVGLMKKKEYAIAQGMVSFVTQMLSYNMTKKNNRDDLLDSCAYGPIMMAQYLGVIVAAANGATLESLIGKAQFGTEIASV